MNIGNRWLNAVQILSIAVETEENGILTRLQIF